ncbi:MAG TPA: hypothetical protein VIY48_16730 [Candidatus Paceibacterota bacterium]
MKRYIPEFGEVRYNGRRKYQLEDLSYLLEVYGESVRQRMVWTLSGEPALLKHVAKLEKMYQELYSAYIKRWA